MREFVLFITIMVFLWIVWFASGGSERGKTDRPFLEPLAPVGTGGTYGPSDFGSPYFEKRKPDTVSADGSEAEKENNVEVPVNKENAEGGQSTISIFNGKISFGSQNRPKETDPQKEYIEIIASQNNDQPILISNLFLKSAVTGRGDIIGEGTYLPYGGRVNTHDPIFLRPGERAYVVTGRSPTGASFRVNTCTGYLGQYQNFYPSLRKECPLPENEELSQEMRIDNKCLDLVEDFRHCEAHVTGFPLGLNSVCQNWISKYVNYNGCVELHGNDQDFTRPEWRIYLARDNELWRDRRETILLLDSNGKIVASLSY